MLPKGWYLVIVRGAVAREVFLEEFDEEAEAITYALAEAEVLGAKAGLRGLTASVSLVQDDGLVPSGTWAWQPHGGWWQWTASKDAA